MKSLIYLICIFMIGCGGKKESKENLIKDTSMVANATSSEKSDTLWVDKLNSNIQWIGRKVVGEHSGRIQAAGGFIVLGDGKLNSGEILINMQSITVDDIENPKWNQKLVDHLKNDDFFNSEKYPTAKFIFSEFKGEGVDTHVKGNMTIRNKTVPLNFLLNTFVDDDSSYASGSINIDRSLFGVKYGSGSFFKGLGDDMIMDDFTLNFKLIAR
ncbi:YceI family protein [Candidatus Marinimicrobia bacterium]|nr:YceI family protein [Candidatus Neomarinimicrobiota bacterium]